MKYRRVGWIMALVASTLFAVGCSQAASGPTLSPDEALAKAQAGEITLIDIRTPPEWRQTGVAPMAERIDMNDPKGPAAFVRKVLDEVDGDKSAPIALICRTGNRSGFMQEQLHSIGFTRVYDVPEGMVGSRAGPGWLRRGLPVEACTNC